MSISQDALIELARSLSGKGNVTGSDISDLLSPELGYLTGTFRGREGTDEDDEEFLYLKYAPNFRRSMNLPDDDIRKIIANELAQGSAPWDVRRQIEEYAAAQADVNPGLYNQDGETSDLLSFADTVYGEINKFNVESQQRSRAASKNDLFAASGLPSPDMDFGMDRLAPDLFDKLSKRSQALEADTQKYRARGKSRSAALEFLGQQKQKKTKRAEDQQTPYPFDEKSEGLRSSLSRNLANTPMGRGEAGLLGLFPLLKMAEQIPAGAAALYRGVTDPIHERAVRNFNYIAKNTIGKSMEDVSLGNDPLGEILYGRDRKGSKPKDDGSSQRAEAARFGRTAQSVVDRSGNVVEDIKRTEQKSKWLQDYSSALDMLLKAKARSVGYTPYQEDLTTRSNFLRSGGL